MNQPAPPAPATQSTSTHTGPTQSGTTQEVGLRCDACGGTLVYDPKQVASACAFCGNTAMTAVPAAELPPDRPEWLLPPTLGAAQAQTAYEQWAAASFWAPAQLKTLAASLRLLLVPAWRFVSDVETHWAGTCAAVTRSGRRPKAGMETVRLEYFAAGSGALKSHELQALRPFELQRAQAWTGAPEGVAWETPGVTRTGASLEAEAALAALHEAHISQAHALLQVKGSSVVRHAQVQLLMTPVFIGAFEFRKRSWRFLVNAQTGEVMGERPVDRVKVGVAVALGAAALVLALRALL